MNERFVKKGSIERINRTLFSLNNKINNKR